MKYTILAFVAVLMMGSVAMADGRGRGGGRGDWHGGDRHGGSSHWSVSLGFGFGSPSYERYPQVFYPPVYRERIYVPAPVYYSPPVYCPPPPVYYSPPVYCPPPTVYYQPVYRPSYDYSYSRVEFYYRR